jgi:predicted cupin superfamily sugar epimerase
MMHALTADDVIALLRLEPLAGEGGYYRETYQVANPDPDRAGEPRTTAILLLVTTDSWSGLHRLETDEMFHFYMGDECRMVVCSPAGECEERRLGTDLRNGCTVQSVAPGGWWQGTMLAGEGEYGYALLGTTMTPGFRADQFTLASASDVRAMPAEAATLLEPFLAPDQR